MRHLAFVLLLGLVGASFAPAAFAEPPTTHEVIYERPSGFWTSNRPAVGGAYRYRMLLIGVAIAGLTGVLTFRKLRRVSAERRAAQSPPR